ncbi:MAG TPA: beta-ketoacyl-[acyl-carrier-protein] synthase family protein [Ktedonobacteraceae bacterium]|nr:beta-ketoacyl-[acyl-carrier-protein] synthase family protein [Ktedonobacteraceae bacterium]
MHRRVVITGLGVIAPNGIGKEQFWDACVSGRSGVRRITRFDASSLPVQIAGEVPNFDPVALGVTEKESVYLDRATHFSIASANMALEDAGLLDKLSEEERERTGVYMGSAMAGIDELEQAWLKLTDSGNHPPREAKEQATLIITRMMTHTYATMVAVHHQLYGPCVSLATACAAGGDAIGEAFRAIQEGYVDRVLAGGADSAISAVGINVFAILGALSTRNEEPERASRPYDALRDGFVMAEGAAILLLEERELALARNARIYAEIIGFSSNINAHHMTAPPPDGAPLQRLLQQVLRQAGVKHEELDYINSHGSSTPPNEVAETSAYKALFGERASRIPISSTKSLIGHAQGASSAIEAVATALTLEHQVIHPTINQEQPDPRCDLDYVPNVARHATVNVALTHSSGFGGVNGALVLARPEWVDTHM